MNTKLITTVTIGVMMTFSAGTAYADAPMITDKQVTFANQTAALTCAAFTEFPNPSGLMGIATGIVAKGDFTLQQAAVIIDYSMHKYCPGQIPAARQALDKLEGTP
jgi:hypothetical protein